MKKYHILLGAIAPRAARRTAAMAATILALGAVAPAAAQSPPVTVTPLFRSATTASGQQITLPSGPVEVIVSEYVIAPGAVLPVHRHPYERYAFVEAGTLRVTNTQTGVATVYRPGDVVVEQIDTWHSGENIGPDVVRLKVIDQVPPGTNNTIIQPGQ
jgi:quercetin dioxygenase-like cupin family protein